MAKLGTRCDDCCFFDNEENCKQNILSQFLKNGAKLVHDEDQILVDRVCQYKRDEKWNEDKPIDEKITICQNEVYIKGTIVLIAYNKDELHDAIKRLKNINKLRVVVLYDGIKSKDILEICGNNLVDYKCIAMKNGNIEFQIYGSLNVAKNGFLFIIECKKRFDENIIDKINTFINKKMFRLLHVSGSDDLHESVNMIHLYKYIKGDLGLDIKSKIEEISKEENSDPQIFTWKEINEEIIN